MPFQTRLWQDMPAPPALHIVIAGYRFENPGRLDVSGGDIVVRELPTAPGYLHFDKRVGKGKPFEGG